MREVTHEEITHWKNQLEDPEFLQHLEEFQKLVYDLCEKHRLKMGMRFIRVVLPRHGVKSLDSVIDKIAKERQGNPTYDFKDIEDLIGIKILCPYPSSAKAVAKWLYTQTDQFTIRPATLQKAWRSYNTGYRGYHFVAEPNLARYSQLVGLKCEIQVKTMCQETWDAMTHETSYKREEAIDKDLLKHMRQLSNVLAAIDEQGELVKNQIERLELEERKKKDAAAITFFLKSADLLKELREQYGVELSSNDPRKFTRKDLEALNVAIGLYRSKVAVTEPLCHLATLLALCQKEPEQEAMALRLAREYRNNKPCDPEAEDVLASVFWAFNRFDQAIACGVEAIRKATEKTSQPPPDKLKANLCYWVADACRAGKKIKEELCTRVLNFSKELHQSHSSGPAGYLDTIGFVHIILGRTAAEIEQGLELVRKARALVSQHKDPRLKRLGETFGARHERLAFLRLAQIFRR